MGVSNSELTLMNKLITILDRTQERSAIDSKDSLLNVLEIYKAC